MNREQQIKRVAAAIEYILREFLIGDQITESQWMEAFVEAGDEPVDSEHEYNLLAMAVEQLDQLTKSQWLQLGLSLPENVREVRRGWL